ncbi:MAG: outer membrane lipoprotein carrier protein LolA [Chlorobi bacterium]|nr:outer membrane lipoprotein carrier protein LolA [Chlorobiota bacterium]
MKHIYLTFAILSTFTAFAQNNNFKKVKNPEAIVEKLNAASKNTKTIDSDFKQYKHLDILENDFESTGHFSFKAPGKVRWEYNKPYSYLIVMNGSDMWINDGDKTKKYNTESNKMFKEINDLMVGMLQGKILKSDKFDIAFYENSNRILAKLNPKSGDMQEFLNEMQLYFDKRNYTVVKIKMLEQSGDYTLIEFYNRKMNIKIPDSKFLLP